jgi:hypothetical protein
MKRIVTMEKRVRRRQMRRMAGLKRVEMRMMTTVASIVTRRIMRMKMMMTAMMI